MRGEKLKVIKEVGRREGNGCAWNELFLVDGGQQTALGGGGDEGIECCMEVLGGCKGA